MIFSRQALLIDRYFFTAGTTTDRLRRFTWELPQTILGYLSAHVLNFSGKLASVAPFESEVVLGGRYSGGSFSLGTFVFMAGSGQPDWRDHLFVHEFGHTRQSRLTGPLYLFLIGLPSVLSFYAERLRWGDHRLRWYETWANRMGGMWFDCRYGSGLPDFEEGSPGHFSLSAFREAGHRSPYKNPRNGTFQPWGYTWLGKWHWTDLPLQIAGILPLAVLLSLIR